MGVARVLDHIVGFFSLYAHLPVVPHPDTLHQIEAYYHLPREVMFPDPPEHPVLAERRTIRQLTYRRQTLVGESPYRPIHPTYQQRHDTEYAANKTLWARRITPHFRHNKDLLIYVHGWMAPGALAEELLLMPWATKLLGADIVHLDLPFHARRKPRSAIVHGSFYWSADLVRTVEAVRQSVMDVRTLIRWARDQGYERVGVCGASLGGVVTMFTACAESDLDWACPLVADVNLTAALENAPILGAMRRDLTRSNLTLEKVGKIMGEVGLADYPLRMERDRMLIVAAVDDLFLQADPLLETWEKWGKPPIHWIPGGHMTIVLNMVPVWFKMNEFIHSKPPLRAAQGRAPRRRAAARPTAPKLRSRAPRSSSTTGAR